MHAKDDLTALNSTGDADASLERRQLVRRIEEASLNAWPAMQQVLLDGWILRFSKGFTKRSNSVIAMYPSLQPVSKLQLAEKVSACEKLYASEGLQTVFRLTSRVAPTDLETHALDQLLEARGYVYADTSLVLTSTELPRSTAGTIRLLSLAEWLRVYCELTGMEEPASELHRLILRGIAGHCGFAAIFEDEQPIACGLAVVEQDLVGLFDIFTHPQHRGRGAARRLVNDLLAWAYTQGARRAYLQVVATNSVAAGLYESMNFAELYRYWYRISS